MNIVDVVPLDPAEDCAQAPGASLNGQKVGTFGDFGCFSFHGAKNITTLPVTLEKSDVKVTQLSLVWVPVA